MARSFGRTRAPWPQRSRTPTGALPFTVFKDGRIRSPGHEEGGVAPATALLDRLNIHSLDGYDVTALPMYRRARLGIGYLPQEASIFRGLTAEENIRAAAELVEPEALIAGLNRGRPGMAAIDVFESEPILQGHPLLRLENCICTPHIGYVEQDNYELYFGAAFDNVVNFIKGTPSNIVNPGALQKRR